MSLKGPDTKIGELITDINREFLRLLTHPAIRDAPEVLGLDGGVLEGLRQLSPEEQELVAVSPLLLAEFSPFPGFAEIRDVPERQLENTALCSAWRSELQGFANRLLTCIWQIACRDRLMTALFVGIDHERCCALSALSFCRISQCSDEAANSLQVRLAKHPRFWTDLIHLVRNGSGSQQIASRMSVIQLSVAQQWPVQSAKGELRYL